MRSGHRNVESRHGECEQGEQDGSEAPASEGHDSSDYQSFLQCTGDIGEVRSWIENYIKNLTKTMMHNKAPCSCRSVCNAAGEGSNLPRH